MEASLKEEAEIKTALERCVSKISETTWYINLTYATPSRMVTKECFESVLKIPQWMSEREIASLVTGGGSLDGTVGCLGVYEG